MTIELIEDSISSFKSNFEQITRLLFENIQLMKIPKVY